MEYKDPNTDFQIELWDCSGNIEYRSCWPAFKEDANAVILVYDPMMKTDEHRDEELLLWRNEFCNLVNEEKLLILAHSQTGNPEETFKNTTAPNCLEEFIIHHTSFSCAENLKLQIKDFFRSLKTRH
jgi:GTPase SAR1 family protein